MHGRQAHEIPAFQRRLDRQAERTKGLRRPVYERSGILHAETILDVGSGSGGVTADLLDACRQGQRRAPLRMVAVDLDASMARRTRAAVPGPVEVLRADGHGLPFADATFDAAVCNLVLLWAAQPERVVAEMARVVRPGGVVVASMEPDYGGKVHWPENPLIDLVFQGEGIRRRGGDPHAGRRLRSHFVKAGLRVEVGILTDRVPTPEDDVELFERNRGAYRRMLAEAGFGPGDIRRWEDQYEAALSDGTQTSFLPVFYAIGRKPVPGDVDRE